jgi:hypothetical protein
MVMELSGEQIKLFLRLVQSARRVCRPRQKFELHAHEVDPAVVFGGGFPEEGEEVLADDVWALHRAELINGTWNYAFDPQAWFTISAKGEGLYDGLRARSRAQEAGVARPPATYVEAMKPPSFFISYSHADMPLAKALKGALVARGCAAWRDEDELRAGDSIVERVADAVHEFDYMAVLVSEASRNSEWCQKELSLAVTNGLKSGRVKVMPLKVGDTEMPAMLADVLYVPIDDDSVDAAADRLVADARRYAGELAAVTAAAPPAATETVDEPVTSAEFVFEPLKITGVVAEGMGSPRNDGTRGSGLYAVPLQLSRSPSDIERRLLVETWDHPPRFTTMHRPGIARVEGDRLVLGRTTIDEIESVHAHTLRLVIEEVNRRAEQLAREDHNQSIERQRQRGERDERARRLKFD